MEAAEERRQEENVEHKDELYCGWGRGVCAPDWLQPLANKKVFLFLFCVTLVLQGMYYTYFASVLTTIEKLFQIKSKTTGLIMSATEMGQIGGALLLAHYGGRGHRPKWISWGMVLFSFCAFLCSLPHFLFSPSLIRESLSYSQSQRNPASTLNICKETTRSTINHLNFTVNPNTSPSSSFEMDINLSISKQEDCSDPNEHSKEVLAIFFIALLGVGIGQTAVYNLGIPYIDDNIANRESAMYFAITIGIRIFGPTFGFLLGSVCTRLYVYPLTDPGFTAKDTRWIGAWWLGHVVVSASLFMASLAMFMFPKHLPERVSCPPAPRAVGAPAATHTERAISTPLKVRFFRSLRDFVKAVQRLLKNEILLLRTASSVLHILPIAGLYTFLPKYLETQFRLTVHSAAMVSGTGGIMVMGIGIFASGVFIKRFAPSPRFIAGWIALTAFLYSCGMVILMFLGCWPIDMSGKKQTESGEVKFMPLCKRTCGNCDDDVFSPVCSKGKTYFSACHVGCSSVISHSNSTSFLLTNCECLDKEDTATLGYCDLDCEYFVWYALVFSLFVLTHSTSEVGGMLVTLRCVDPQDKAMALGLLSVAIGLFGNVPCPIIYGSVVDYACIHWRKSCNEVGACELYDTDVFRLFFHGTTAAVMAIAFIVDLAVWHKAKGLSFLDSESMPADDNDDFINSAAKDTNESPVLAVETVDPLQVSLPLIAPSYSGTSEEAIPLQQCSADGSSSSPILVRAKIIPESSKMAIMLKATTSRAMDIPIHLEKRHSLSSSSAASVIADVPSVQAMDLS